MKAKDGAGSATLSMAYAGAEFTEKIIRAVKGETGIIAPTFVHLTSAPGGEGVKGELNASDLEYFSCKVELGVCICVPVISANVYLLIALTGQGC